MWAFQYRQLLTQRGFRRRQVVHAEPGRQRADRQERHPDPGGIFQPDAVAGDGGLTHIGKTKNGTGDRQRGDKLHHADAKITEAAVDAQRAALTGFGKEEADIAHARREVSATKTAQQGNHHKSGE